MGKHLTIAEKLNAEKEILENKQKIKKLRKERRILKYYHSGDDRVLELGEEIAFLQKRNNRLMAYLWYAKQSKHNGLYGIDGLCHKMFGKRFRALTFEEKQLYFRAKEKEYKEQKEGVAHGK